MGNNFFLERIKIESFGLLSQKVFGPFEPKLNVVFGKNEAGKTTLTAFIGGLLFGWEEARGQRNTYKPQNAERSGSLIFSSANKAEELELSRTKNTDGLVGQAELVDDIDKETFKTIFALTGDELRSLRKTTDITAKLLTAGSGTNSSPAETLQKIQKEIQAYTSRAAGAEHSLVNIEAEIEQLRDLIAQATEEAQRFRQQDKEFYEIMPQRDRIIEQLNKLNKEIEYMSAAEASLEKIEHQIEQNAEKRVQLEEEQWAVNAETLPSAKEETHGLEALGLREENAIRDALESFSEEHNKYEIRVSNAQENYLTSKAAYDALVESETTQERADRQKTQRRIQAILSIVFPCIFMIAGIPTFMRGREVDSLSFTMLGIGLIGCALVMAAGALFVLFKPSKAEEEQEKRREDAHWVMLQDKKKLEACEKDLAQLESKIENYLKQQGLGAAQSSLRRARSLLDEAREIRTKDDVFKQRQAALNAQLSALEESELQQREQRAILLKNLHMGEEDSSATVAHSIERKAQQREALMESGDMLNRRYGELKQELAQAKTLRDLDKYKLQYEEALTRQKESAQDYARLVLARRMLESAISAWESKSQPEVYAQASRLFNMMTKGKWTQVRLSEKGDLEVVDAVKTVRDPLHLSLGTCQQLYLSLRIALLMTAENVGRALPIMADDILVNFDEDRRKGAAQALFELSEKRQVILFTCHKDMVNLMCELDSTVNVVEL